VWDLGADAEAHDDAEDGDGGIDTEAAVGLDDCTPSEELAAREWLVMKLGSAAAAAEMLPSPVPTFEGLL